MRRNIYQGHRSCYAINEGIYVPGHGVNLQTAVSIAYLIFRDFRRGWTYDHQCRKIPMDFELMRKRLFYLIPLARKHYGKEEEKKVKEFVTKAFLQLGIPREYRRYIKIVGLEKLKVPIEVKVPVRKRRIRR